MKTILVTGGAGYIGSHTCKALARVGYEPVVYDNLHRGFAHAVKWGTLEQGDIRDKNRLSEVLKRWQPDAVIHFAALAYVGESVLEPGKYWHNNVTGSLTLIESLIEHGIDKIVFSSSCAVYGEPGPDAMPINESLATNPVNPYGTSKLVVEQILKDVHHAHNFASVSLRYFNAAGADMEGEVGENHDPETHLIPLILESARNPDSPLTVFGTDYATHDGSCVRDYIHVDDLADAHLRALEYIENTPGAHQFNLGTGHGHSVLELIKAASKVTGVEANFLQGDRRPGDPPLLISDPSLAIKELGWQAKYPKINDMIASAWNWINR